jgi:very-short-patch-repair endonuclease
MPISADEIVRRGAFQVTGPARTWRDLATVLQPPALLAVADQCLDGLCVRADLEQQLSRRPTGRGSARARAILPLADRRAESPMESVLRWLLVEAGIPRPVIQHVVHDASGRFIARADLAWPDKKVIVEFDGDLHRDRGIFVKDLRRQNALIAEGWTILRFSSADVLGRPEEVIAEISRALGL